MIEEILAYQEVDARLRKIETELSNSEERKKAMIAKKYLDGVEESVNKLDVRAKDLISAYNKMLDEQLKLKEQEEEFSRAVASAQDETEASYLMKKIDELIGKIKNLSKEASAVSDEIQNVLKEYKNIKTNTKAMQLQYTENGKKYNEFKSSLQGERESVEAELKKLSQKVDKSLMEKYLSVRAKKIYPVVYEVNDRICGACNMELPMSELNRLKNGEIIECDQCGRLLYKLDK